MTTTPGNPDDRKTLVDRLRGISKWEATVKNSGIEHIYETPPIQHEAAAEIERLRALLLAAGRALIANPTARRDAGEVDMAELVVRLVEAMSGITRPDNVTPAEALDRLAKTDSVRAVPDMIPTFFRVASTAVEYITGRQADASTRQ